MIPKSISKTIICKALNLCPFYVDIVTLRVEKQKDAEPMEGDLRFNMLVVPASISETSVVLELTDEQATRNRKALTFEQEIALEALRSALADR